MKRFSILFLALLLTMTACGKPAPEAVEEQPAVQQEETVEEASPPQEEAEEEPAEESSSAQEDDIQAAAQAEAERQAAAQAEAERQAAAQAEAERQAAAQAEAERQAAAQAEAERQAAAQAEAERQAAAQAEAERQAAAQAEAERQAAAQAEAERQAALEKEKKEQTENVQVSGENFLPKVESKIIRLINEMREEEGLSPLTYDENLQKAARIRSKELYDNQYFAHTRPNGENWDTVLTQDVPIPNKGRGENLAMAEASQYTEHRTAQQWVNQWANSPGHYENMMRPEFTHIGLGVYYQIEADGSYSTYATTIFGIL